MKKASIKSLMLNALLAVLTISFMGCQQNGETSKEEDPRMAGFKGKIAMSFEDSVEDWPEVETFTGEEPNVLLILLDDVGYGQLGPYGGLTKTPNIDKLAKNGLLYNNFHTTALCSPSRAAILAGRNTHSIGMGSHALSAMGFPGYAGRVPMEAQEVTKIAQKAGWSTYALGKWDHTPGFQTHQVGPFGYWPTNDGFDHTYNFMAADANNFTPVMYAGHEPVEPSRGNPDYHLSTDLSDKATHYLTGHASIDPDRPFFMFWAPGGMHAPHHAPKEYIDKYKGKFDMGWDVAREEIHKRQLELGVLPEGSALTERNKEIPAWDSLTDDEKRMYSRQMEAFAGQLEHLDMEIGRMLATLERIGKLENTLIILTSDNGASGEGGLSGSHNEMLIVNSQQTSLEENLNRYDVWGSEATDNHYHAGWALAGNTPFKYFKQTVHNGGIKDPLLLHWPAGIKGKGEVRNQYHHIIDIAPTILDVLDLEFMEEIDGIKQMPIDGTSFAYSLNEPDAADQHTTQYYEMYGNRAIYKDGWKAVTIHGNRMPWDFAGTYPFEDDVWELYNVSEDFTESNDLAEEYPEKLEELKAAWEDEAWKYNVFPLYDDLGARFSNVAKIYAPSRKEFIFYPPGAVRISEPYSPPVKNKNHSLTAHAEIPSGGASGVLVAAGGLYGGYTLFVENNQLVYEYNAFNENRFTIKSNSTLPEGKVELKAVYDVNEDKTATVTLFVNGEQVGQGPVNRTHPGQFSLSETFDVGQDTGTPVSKSYTRENAFSGTLDKLVVNLK